METGEMICKTLPEELVERIVSMVPFPSIFKLRCLSKSWLARLSSFPHEEGDAKKRHTTSFQQLVSERSTNWKTFSPVYISVKGALVPCDDLQATQNWRKMPSLSFLPKKVRTKLNLQMEGPLALMFATLPESDGDIYVANILNNTWRPLPPSPSIIRRKILCSKLVLIDKSLGTYKVILFCKGSSGGCYHTVEIYDSKSDSWTSNNCHEKDFFEALPSTNFAYFNGLVYFVSDFGLPKLYAFNLEDGSLKKLELSSFNEKFSPSYNFYFLVVCKDDLLMVICKTEFVLCFEVLKIDLESLTLVHLAESPSPSLADTDTFELMHIFSVSDGNCIFFDGYCDRRLLKYEIENDTWSWLLFPKIRGVGHLLTSFAFEPGLSPFAAV